MTTLCTTAPPQMTAYCHCGDCRRITGAPVAAFCAFEPKHLHITPDPGPGFSIFEGVRRWSCKTCGSPLAAQFSYLPDQAYVPLGLLDQIDDLAPQIHCHADRAAPWLEIADTLPRAPQSARSELNTKS